MTATHNRSYFSFLLNLFCFVDQSDAIFRKNENLGKDCLLFNTLIHDEVCTSLDALIPKGCAHQITYRFRDARIKANHVRESFNRLLFKIFGWV